MSWFYTCFCGAEQGEGGGVCGSRARGRRAGGSAAPAPRAGALAARGLQGTAALRALRWHCQGRQDLQARLTDSPYTVQQRKGIFGPGWVHRRGGWETPAMLAMNERCSWTAGMPGAGLMAHITPPFSTCLVSAFCRRGFGLPELSFKPLCSLKQRSGTSDTRITFLRFSWKQQGQ